MKFYLGTHQPHWLRLLDVPLFVSHRRLKRYKTLPQAIAPWALDSGGFTELSMHGEWQTPPHIYVANVRRYADQIGNMDWAAPQDWMCEPFILDKTGLTVADHQQKTLNNLLTLRTLSPDLPFIPVLQGWEHDDYLRHADMYQDAGIDLATEPVVGVGSVCRRQGTSDAAKLMFALGEDINLHGFGVKITGLAKYGHMLTSSDSMAWSFDARYADPIPGHSHKNCANCIEWAMGWRDKIGIIRPR